ncbi:MAG: Na+/solute symporter [Deltaproteobacteria bacterium]|nr:Na+/solute symporter [Deltaproteobacteria bacterium]
MNGIYFLAVLAYVFLLWLTGFLVTKKSRSSDAYLLASRGLSIPLVSVLIAGTWTGGVSVVGMAQGAYIHGISALWFQFGIWVAMFVTAMFFEKIIQGKTTYSIIDVVGSLYGKNTAQFAGLLQFVFMVWVITMNIVGGGAILSFILREYLSFGQGMVLTAIVFTLYNTAGGLVATAYTNLVHIAAILIGMFIGGIYVIVNTGALTTMASTGHYFQPFGDLGMAEALSWAYINFTLALLAQPVINTASSAVGVRQGKIGIITGNLLAVPVVAMAALCGIVSRSVFPGLSSLSALPALLQIVPVSIGILFLIAMWAPVMSAGSPYLMAATTIAVKGYVGPLLGVASDRKLLVASRLTTVGIGLVSLLLGFFVREILREITWLAVLLSAIAYIVFFGWLVKRIPSVWAFTALAGTVVILFFLFVFGFYKVMHPVWPVTIYVFAVLCFGLVASRSKSG